MKINVITVPYHMGRRRSAVGLGPLRYLEGGLGALLQSGGHDVTLVPIEAGDNTTIDLINGLVRNAVAAAEASRAFPLVIAGNCNSCLGTLEGLRRSGLGTVWFDAHGDFHTRESSISGNMDGMALALATERFIPEDRTTLAGFRDLDPGERERVAGSRMRVIPWERSFTLTNLPAAERVYVHVDVDVVDSSVNPGVNFRGSGGLSFEQLENALRTVRARYPLAAAALTNYNPELDVDARTRDLGLRIARVIASLL